MGSHAVILLDTHALVWMDGGNARLGPQARKQIDDALHEDVLMVSAISFWELGMLQTKGRIRLPDLARWRVELLSMGLREIPLNGEHGIVATTLADFHPDPADRLIVATAMLASAKLVTADQRILAWTGELETIDAGE